MEIIVTTEENLVLEGSVERFTPKQVTVITREDIICNIPWNSVHKVAIDELDSYDALDALEAITGTKEKE